MEKVFHHARSFLPTHQRKYQLTTTNKYIQLGFQASFWFKLRIEFIKDPDWNQYSHTFYGIDSIKVAYSSDDPKRVTKCDFDKNHCTVRYFLRNNTYASLRSSMATSSQLITDVSSTGRRSFLEMRTSADFSSILKSQESSKRRVLSDSVHDRWQRVSSLHRVEPMYDRLRPLRMRSRLVLLF